jgi:hypothetical protein
VKYTIHGFQQKKLVENHLNTDDALILSVIKDMYASAKMEYILEDGNKYMWINYTYLLNEIPIIGKKRNLMTKIKMYADELYLLRLLKYEKKGVKGTYAFICPTKKLDELTEYDYDPMQNLHTPYAKTCIPPMQNLHNKDSSIIDPPIIDNKPMDIDVYFDKLWDIYPKKKGKSSIKKSTKEKLYKVGFDKLKKAIENYKEEISILGTEEQYIKYGSSFFNTNWTDYIDGVYIKPSNKQEKTPERYYRLEE